MLLLFIWAFHVLVYIMQPNKFKYIVKRKKAVVHVIMRTILGDLYSELEIIRNSEPELCF